jgi:predicted pyridoxine 5'-phosphate oxidase superfamily flavin-nucleotide-binding protein
MTKLTQEMKDLIETQKVSFVATADKNGKVNVSPKGSIYVVDDQTLAFADLYSRKTRENLRVNSHVAVAVVDLKGLRGYQFKGKGELLEEGDLYNDVVCYLQTLPLKLPDPQYVVKIQVDEVYGLGLGK